MASDEYWHTARQARSLLLAASSVVEAHLLNLPVSDPTLAGVVPGYVDAGGRWQLSPFHDGDARRLPELPELEAPPLAGTVYAEQGTAAIGPASATLLGALIASGGPRPLADLAAAAKIVERPLLRRRYLVHDLRAAHALMLGLEQRGLVERRAIRLDDLGRLRWVWQVYTPGVMPSATMYPELAALSFETLADLLDIELKRDRPNLDGSVDVVLGGPRSEQQSGDELHEELPLLDVGDGAQITPGVVLHQLTLMGAEMRRPWADALGEHFFVWLDTWLKAPSVVPTPWELRDLGMELLHSVPWFGPSLRWTAGSLLRRKAPVGVLKGLLFAGLWSDDLVMRAAAGAIDYKVA
ncbi:hypothetical protein [Chloroflexus sp.]|uniref:hypothetical protein n=1 Tax=Chloroflexus sp. TaxID=1904827 RepID=UPI002ACDF763|nr:hypothetical protein [Chloroflexus sp.]